MALIEVKELTKCYYKGTDAEIHALRGVTLSVKQGELTAIVGRSGSGKSTLLHLLGCLDRPDSGEYRLDGVPVREMSDRAMADIRNRKIGFVLQHFGLLPRRTALENVAVPLYLNPSVRRGEIRQRAWRALDRVGLHDKSLHKAAELSGGQKQRVAIARAVINSPKLLLADEPTGALDRTTADEMMSLLRELNQNGLTVLIVTHDPIIAANCRRVITISDGMIVNDSRQ